MVEHRRLRTYLGSAPGVGKTYAMLEEGLRRAAGGDHVVVGWIEAHDRTGTLARMRDLDVAAPRSVEYRGYQFDEMDLDAILDLSPDLVLVDELAHSWPDGHRHRWEDVAELLERPVDVFTTVNVANLESARDYAARITGAGMVEPVPDDLVRSGEVVLVDLPADALRRRIAHGDVYSTDRVGGALSRYFASTNLTSLSELARAWVDDRVTPVGEALARAGGGAPTRPTIIAGISASAWAEPVIRRAAAIAADERADLLVVHVDVADGLNRRETNRLLELRNLASNVGGLYSDVRGDNVAGGLAAVALEHRASHVIVARHRSRVGELLRPSVAARLRRLLPGVEIDEVDAQLPND